jgi:hypothetical protein
MIIHILNTSIFMNPLKVNRRFDRICFTSIEFRRTAQRYVSEDRTHHNGGYENLKFCRLHFVQYILRILISLTELSGLIVQRFFLFKNQVPGLQSTNIETHV